MMTAQSNWLAYKQGRACEESWEYARLYAASHLRFRVGGIWWKNAKDGYQADFAAAIDEELGASDSVSPESIVRQILGDIKKLDGA